MVTSTRRKILISEDDAASRRALEAILEESGYEVVVTSHGEEARDALASDREIRITVLDWEMPRMDGSELASHIRSIANRPYVYVILLTARSSREDVVAGLESGADDYLVKPFDRGELLSRVRVGERIIQLEAELSRKVHELEEAIAHVKRLQGLIPICMHCKKIRDDQDTWHSVETYLEQHSEAMLSHGICGDCLEQYYPEE